MKHLENNTTTQLSTLYEIKSLNPLLRDTQYAYVHMFWADRFIKKGIGMWRIYHGDLALRVVRECTGCPRIDCLCLLNVSKKGTLKVANRPTPTLRCLNKQEHCSSRIWPGTAGSSPHG